MANLIVLNYKRISKPCPSGRMFVARLRIHKFIWMANGLPWPLAPDTCLTLDEVLFTAQTYGPVQVVLRWDAHYADPLYLVTTLELGEEACYWYQQRSTLGRK